MKKKQKGIAPLLGIILIFSLFAIGAIGFTVWYQRTEKGKSWFSDQLTSQTNQSQEVFERRPEESSKADEVSQPTIEAESRSLGWQQYHNEIYHYKIIYPHDWYFHQTGYSPPPPYAISVSNVPETERYDNNAAWFDVVMIETEGIELDNFPEILNLESQGWERDLITVAGKDAVKMEDPNPDQSLSAQTIFIYIWRGGYICRLSWSGRSAEVRNKHLHIFKKMVDNFVFTD